MDVCRGGGQPAFWENVHPLASVEFLQNKIHAFLINPVTCGDTQASALNFYSEGNIFMTQEEIPLYCQHVIKRSRRDSPLQTGTHFPLLKNREWSSLVKQMSDAAGVLKKTNKSDWMTKPQLRWENKKKNHQRILLKSHRCLSFRTPAEKTHKGFWCYRACLVSHPRCVGLTPDVWVIHTRLVIGQSDERCVWRPLVNEIQQDLLVVDRQVVHVLWGRKNIRTGLEPTTVTRLAGPHSRLG